MAINAGTVVADAKMNMRGFDRSMKRMKRQGEKTAAKISSSFKNVGRRMRSIGMGMTAGITAPLIGAGTMALKTAADYESLRQSMDILNKSAEEGGRNFRRLKEFSARTPFQLRDLAQAQNMLQGFGQSADDAFNSMKMIGDIAAVASGDIQGIGIAFGQAAAEGRLMTRDIRQLINQGVPAIKLLSNTMGVAQDEVLDLASEGKISFEILQQAFKDATSEGGMFANGMKQQAQTLSGVWSTLKDNFSLALGEIGQSMADAFNIKDLARSLIANLQNFTDWFANLSDEAKRMGFAVAAALGAGGPALIALGTLSAAIGALISPIGAVIAATAGIGAAFVAIAGNWEAVKERISNVTWWRNTLIKMVQLLIEYNPFSLITKGINQILSRFGDTQIPNIFEGMSAGLGKLRDDTVQYETEFKGVMGTVRSAIKNISGFDIGSIFTTKVNADEIKEAVANYQQLSNSIGNVKGQITGIPEGLQSVNDNLSITEIALKGVSDAAAVSTKFMVGMFQTLDTVFQQAVIHGRKLGSILKNIARQLASKALINGLAMLVSGGSFGLGKLLFGNVGSIIGVNDALIRSDGSVVKFHPDDNILAMKDFSNLAAPASGRGGGMSANQMEKAFDRALGRRLQKLSNGEIYAMAQKGRRGF